MSNMYKDKFGNTAVIERAYVKPFRESKEKIKSYRLILSSDYENDFIYHISLYETKREAVDKLRGFSGGSFEEV